MKKWLRPILFFSLGFCFLCALNLIKMPLEVIKADVYKTNAISFVEDGDLNLINNLAPDDAWLVAGTGHYGGWQEFGNVALVWPVYFYEKVLMRLGVQTDSCRISVYEFSRIICQLLTLLVLFYLASALLKNLGLEERKTVHVTAIFFGTPLFWYGFFQTSSVSVLACAVLTFALYSMTEQLKKDSVWSWGVIGVLFCFLYQVKFESLFFSFSPVIFILLYYTSFKSIFQRLGVYLLGWLSIASFQLINTYQKFQTTGNPFLFVMRSQESFPHEQFEIAKNLFGPGGAFFVSPLSILGFIAIVKSVIDSVEKRRRLDAKESFYMSLAVPFFFTVLYGATHFLNVTHLDSNDHVYMSICFLIGVALFYDFIKLSRLYRRIFSLSIFLFCAWNILFVGMYFADTKHFALTYPLFDWINISSALKAYWMSVQFTFPVMFPYLIDMIGFCSPLVLIIYLCNRILKLKTKLNWKMAVGIIFVSYTFVTSINLVTNKANVAEMLSQGFYKDKRVGKSINLFLYDEYIRSSQKLMQSYQMRGRLDDLQNLKTLEMSWELKAKATFSKRKLGAFPDRLDGHISSPVWENLDKVRLSPDHCTQSLGFKSVL